MEQKAASEAALQVIAERRARIDKQLEPLLEGMRTDCSPADLDYIVSNLAEAAVGAGGGLSMGRIHAVSSVLYAAAGKFYFNVMNRFREQRTIAETNKG
jgi:hypothetical protein